MCCQETKTLGLPAEVIEALAHYRQLLDERGIGATSSSPTSFGGLASPFSDRSSRDLRPPAIGRKPSVR